MNTTKEHSKRLSWLLRHGANSSGLAMDDAGFALVADVLQKAGLTRAELDVVVSDNDKARYEVRGDHVRAVQGHSLDGTPVTLEGLERSWLEVVDPAPLFHGTSVANARAILSSEGVHAAARSHVHLAPAADALVGKRAAVDVILLVDGAKLRACGERVFRAPNGVLLTRAVPRSAIAHVDAVSRAGRAAVDELRVLLAAVSQRG